MQTAKAAKSVKSAGSALPNYREVEMILLKPEDRVLGKYLIQKKCPPTLWKRSLMKQKMLDRRVMAKIAEAYHASAWATWVTCLPIALITLASKCAFIVDVKVS